MIHMSPFQSLPVQQSHLTRENLTPKLQYLLSPILFTASPEPLPITQQVSSSANLNSLQVWDIPSCPPSLYLLLQNLKLMELQIEVHHLLPYCASPEQLCALANLGGGQLKAIRQELIRYPNRSLYKIFPWDHNCLVRAVLHQM